jgi:hypothetical protein
MKNTKIKTKKIKNQKGGMVFSSNLLKEFIEFRNRQKEGATLRKRILKQRAEVVERWNNHQFFSDEQRELIKKQEEINGVNQTQNNILESESDPYEYYGVEDRDEDEIEEF